MDTARFDRMTRTFSTVLSRRGLAGALGVAAGAIPGLAAAKKKKKKLKKNAFGCVDVGGKCRGNDANCCSGICQGKKPKKGKKDKSTCVAHDVGDCQADQDACVGGDGNECTTSGGEQGACFRTTGKASYCAADVGACFSCSRDVDCQEVCGANAACVVCTGCTGTGGAACVGADTCAFPP